MRKTIRAAFVMIAICGACAVPRPTTPQATSTVSPQSTSRVPSPSPALIDADLAFSPTMICGRIGDDACKEAIDLVAAVDSVEVHRATAIVVDDTCPPRVLCDRRWPFDVLVVLVRPEEVGGDVLTFSVTGVDGPEAVHPWAGELPAHIAALVTTSLARR